MPRRSELTTLPPARKRQRGIPWDEIADGAIWELIHGEDFKGKPEGVESRIHSKAKAMGRSVETRYRSSRAATSRRSFSCSSTHRRLAPTGLAAAAGTAPAAESSRAGRRPKREAPPPSGVRRLFALRG